MELDNMQDAEVFILIARLESELERHHPNSAKHVKIYLEEIDGETYAMGRFEYGVIPPNSAFWDRVNKDLTTLYNEDDTSLIVGYEFRIKKIDNLEKVLNDFDRKLGYTKPDEFAQTR